jgi:hypothetical protein
MRGTPTVHLALLLALFIVLAVPLIRLTGGEAQVRTAPVIVSATEVPMRLSIRCSHAPSKLSVKHGSRDLLNEVSPTDARYETDCALPLPAEGIELSVDATWPPGTQNTALTITLEPAEHDALNQTVWADRDTLSEIIVFHWRAQP